MLSTPWAWLLVAVTSLMCGFSCHGSTDIVSSKSVAPLPLCCSSAMPDLATYVERIRCICRQHACVYHGKINGLLLLGSVQGLSRPRVAVVNGVGFHTEVYCALLWSFVRAGLDTEAFVELAATARVEDVIQGWCGRLLVISIVHVMPSNHM